MEVLVLIHVPIMAFQKKKPDGKHSLSSPTPHKELRVNLQDTTTTMFAEVSSPDTFQKKKLKEEHSSSSPTPITESGGEFQDRVETIGEVSSSDAIQKKKLEEKNTMKTKLESLKFNRS